MNLELLEELLSRPTPEVIDDLARIGGDIIVLGVGGKMGPTLARMACRAGRRVIGVARFSTPGLRESLESCGVETLSCDLLTQARRLPDADNVIFMPGMKFGTSGAEAQTWATNAYLPGVVAERYRKSRIVVFSTGNVYPFVPVSSGGATEETPPGPIGEYAQSALARERVFEYFSREFGTPMTMYRLNYAVELRYGILLDIAQKVWSGIPIDVTMGSVNVLWQGDANAAALRCLALAKSPPKVVNVTGPETLRVRDLAARFGELLGRAPRIVGQEADTALLSRASRVFTPSVPVDQVIEWVAEWVRSGGETLNKPTRFETRNGRF